MTPEPCRIVHIFSVLAHIIPGNLYIWAKNTMIFKYSSPKRLNHTDSEPGGTESQLLHESNRLPPQRKRENACRTD